MPSDGSCWVRVSGRNTKQFKANLTGLELTKALPYQTPQKGSTADSAPLGLPGQYYWFSLPGAGDPRNLEPGAAWASRSAAAEHQADLAGTLPALSGRSAHCAARHPRELGGSFQFLRMNYGLNRSG